MNNAGLLTRKFELTNIHQPTLLKVPLIEKNILYRKSDIIMKLIWNRLETVQGIGFRGLWNCAADANTTNGTERYLDGRRGGLTGRNRR